MGVQVPQIANKRQNREAYTARVLHTFCKLLCKLQLNAQLKTSTAQVHKYNMFQRGVRVNRGPGTSNQIAHNCCANTNEIYTKSSTAQVHKCTCSREGERVDGVQVAEPAPRRSVAAPPLERRKPQSYFLFSQFFGFTFGTLRWLHLLM